MLKRKTYSREYKIGAIQMVDQKGMTMREVSEALGINDGMLWRWRKTRWAKTWRPRWRWPAGTSLFAAASNCGVSESSTELMSQQFPRRNDMSRIVS